MPIPFIAAGVAAAKAAGVVAAAGTVAKGAAAGAAVVGGAVVGSATVSAIDEVARNIDTSREVLPEPGSILITKLHVDWHSGVYIGNNEIVELKGGLGEGNVRKVSPRQFRDDGITRFGINIFIACDKSGNVLANRSIARRAKESIGAIKDYFLITENCHQFTSGCITDSFNNPDNFKKFLETTISKELNNGREIRWFPWETE